VLLFTTSSKKLTASERREAILAAAGELFAKKGFDGTRTKDLAKSCGVSESVIFKHFPTKKALFEAVLWAKVEELDVDSFLSTLPEGQPLEETLKAIADKIFEVGVSDPGIHRLLLAATEADIPEADRLYMSWRIPFVKHIEKLLRQRIEQGEVHDVDPLLTARSFVGLVMDCVLNCNLWAKLGYGDYESCEFVNNNVPIWVRGLLKTSPANGGDPRTKPS
jgi:AcrR family transcriptional regulator